MTMESVTITVPFAPGYVDQHDVRLAAKRTIVPAATDALGTRIAAHGANTDERGHSLDSSWYTVEVLT